MSISLTRSPDHGCDLRRFQHHEKTRTSHARRLRSEIRIAVPGASRDAAGRARPRTASHGSCRPARRWVDAGCVCRLGQGTQSVPKGDDGIQGKGRGEVSVALVGVGGNTAEIREVEELRPAPPAVTIAPLVEADLALAGTGAGHDQTDAPASTAGAVFTALALPRVRWMTPGRRIMSARTGILVVATAGEPVGDDEVDPSGRDQVACDQGDVVLVEHALGEAASWSRPQWPSSRGSPVLRNRRRSAAGRQRGGRDSPGSAAPSAR